MQGNESAWALLSAQQITGIDGDAGEAPSLTKLIGASPNPFNPTTTIGLSLARPEKVSLVVYDTAGRQVRVLVDEVRSAGRHEVRWDGRADSGRTLGSGVYFCRLQAGDIRDTRRLTLVK